MSYGSSGTFYAQLLNQAPFDLFLSADVAYPNQLAARGLTLPQSEFTYAIGRLALWAPASSSLDVEHDGLQALRDTSIAHVAVANPEHARPRRAAVTRCRRRAVQRVRSGWCPARTSRRRCSSCRRRADAGIVALSLTLAPNVKDKGAIRDSVSTHPRMEQGGAILSGRPTWMPRARCGGSC